MKEDLRDEFGEQRKQYEQTLAALEKDLKDAVNLIKALGGKELNSNSRSLDPLTLEGIVVDDLKAIKKGSWKSSTHTPGYVGADIIMMTIPVRGINPSLLEPISRMEESMTFRYPILMGQIVRRKLRLRLCMPMVNRKFISIKQSHPSY